LNENIAGLSADIAINNHLRGSDAVYAAVARRFGTKLVALDKEQLKRLQKVISVQSPALRSAVTRLNSRNTPTGFSR
jgi:predicted nucleic acid-binding protein